MADIILIKTEKNSLNLLEHQNVTNYTATADTVQLDVHVARIVRAKHTCLLRSFNCLVNCSSLGRSNRRGEIFFTAEMSTFLHIRIYV